MKSGLAVLGAGPHGREVARLLLMRFSGEVDVRLYDDYLPNYPKLAHAFGVQCIIGAAMPAVRIEIDRQRMGSAGASLLGVTQGGGVGRGNVVFTGAQISPFAQLGEHVHVLYNAVVSHGCQVGDFVTICSGAVLCGEVTVESGAFIGANATIRHGGITIGRNAVVGMGAVVVDDVPDGAKVVGNPAKILMTL